MLLGECGKISARCTYAHTKVEGMYVRTDMLVYFRL